MKNRHIFLTNGKDKMEKKVGERKEDSERIKRRRGEEEFTKMCFRLRSNFLPAHTLTYCLASQKEIGKYSLT